jgi:hypothetical protein
MLPGCLRPVRCRTGRHERYRQLEVIVGKAFRAVPISIANCFSTGFQETGSSHTEQAVHVVHVVHVGR